MFSTGYVIHDPCLHDLWIPADVCDVCHPDLRFPDLHTCFGQGGYMNKMPKKEGSRSVTV